MDPRAFATMVAAGVIAGAPARAECPATGPQAARVADVAPRLELRLADGRRLRLAGLDPAQQTPGDPDLAESVRARLAALVAGKPVTIRVLAAAPDRWGRWPAEVFGEPPAAGGSTPAAGGLATAAGGLATAAGGLATTAVAAGLGRYLAEPAADACRSELLSAEGAARQAKLGLWADPYYSVLAADDRAAFSERSGTLVVAEGRLVAVEPGPFRTRLRLAAPGAGRQLLTATILPRVMKAFEAKGVTFQSLIGSTLRLRGLLDLNFGPHIELDGPDAVEIAAGRR